MREFVVQVRTNGSCQSTRVNVSETGSVGGRGGATISSAQCLSRPRRVHVPLCSRPQAMNSSAGSLCCAAPWGHTCVCVWVPLFPIREAGNWTRARQPRTPSFASSGMPTLVFMQKSASKVQQPHMCFQLTQALDVDGVGGRVSMGYPLPSYALTSSHRRLTLSGTVLFTFCTQWM